jgi:hypothetical protein
VSTPVLVVLAAVAVFLWPVRHNERLPPGRATMRIESGWAPGQGDGSGDAWSPSNRLAPSSRDTWRGRLLARLGRPHHGAAPALGDVADSLVLLALALRAGLGLAEALQEVHVGSQGRVRRDLASVVAALQWGKSAPEAWAFASPVWRQVAQAWEVAVQTGSAPAEQVELVAQRLRDAQERDREQRTVKAGVWLVLPLGFGFLPAFVCTSVVPVVLAVAAGVVGG